MINLGISMLEKPLRISGPVYLVIQNQQYYAKVVRALYEYGTTDDINLFDSNFSNLKDSELLRVTDILNFDLNSNTILKLIYADLEQQLNIEVEIKTKLEYLTNQITDIIGKEILNHELDLVMDEITVYEVFKSLGIKIDVTHESIHQKVLDIIQVFKYLNRKKCLIFINISPYLSKKEMLSIREYVFLNQIDVLFLERYSMLGFENHILDEDFYFYNEFMI